jgi:NAD(P)-dependent dehydrogenase (short-subunit alcohol dehydrogenase family)
MTALEAMRDSSNNGNHHMRMNNKVVLITGVTSDIGAATVKRFAEEGATLALTDMQPADTAMLSAMGAADMRHMFQQADLREEAQVVALFDSVAQRFGRLDVLVNIAGGDFGKNVELEELDVANLQRNIDANLTSTMLTCREAVKIMKPQSAGAIVNMCSMTFRGSSVNQFAYASSKGAVFALTRTLAMTLGKHGIRVNAVAPGMIEVESIKKTLAPGVWEGVSKWIGSTYPLGRVGQPVEIANCMLFLASDEASFVTGEVLEVSGGGRL